MKNKKKEKEEKNANKLLSLDVYLVNSFPMQIMGSTLLWGWSVGVDCGYLIHCWLLFSLVGY